MTVQVSRRRLLTPDQQSPKDTESNIPAQEQQTLNSEQNGETLQTKPEQNQRRRPLTLSENQIKKPQKEPSTLDVFGQGLLHSASGELSGAITERPIDKSQETPGFWNSVIREVGNIVGDAPFMAAGATIGSALGASAGSFGGPAGTTVGGVAGGAAGALALPAFLKEASREYRAFQESGGNLTFGEFLQSADKVANSTLREGAFGLALGSINKGMTLLRKIPSIDKLFNTRYIGPVAKQATEIGGEVAGATTIPAATEGRLPTADDVARAAVLFSGQRGARLPAQLMDAMRESKSQKFNYALADRIKKLDLAYPPLFEFKLNSNPVYKNSLELDRNISSFDKSFIDNISSKINNISVTEFPSADAAGREMYNKLGSLAAVQIVPQVPSEPSPVKPETPLVPLTRNPFNVALDSITQDVPPSKAELGRRISNQYREGRRAEYRPLKERYQEQEKELEGVTFVDQGIADQIENFIAQFEPGATPGSDAHRIVKQANYLLDLLVQRDEEGNIAGYLPVQAHRFAAVNRTIKQIPNWDVPPEMLDNLNTLTQNMDNALVGQLLNVNDALAERFIDLNADYSNFKNRWDNRDMRVFYDRTVNNEKVASTFTRLDEFTQLAEAFDGTPEGNNVLNMIRREVWTDRLGRDALTARTEQEFDSATQKNDQRFYSDLMEFLSPEQREVVSLDIDHANQVRQSALRTAGEYEGSKREYKQKMREWEERENSRKKNQKKLREDVQGKQDLLVGLLQEDPAKLVQNMQSIEGIRRVKEATKKVEGGQDLYDSMARYETDRMFDFMRKGYMRTGRVPYSELRIQMKDKEFRAKLRELNGDEFIRNMDELIDVTGNLSKQFLEKVVEFKDDPSTLSNILHIYSVLGLAQGNIMTPLMAFTAKKNLLRLGNKAYNMWVDKRYYDQKNIEKVLKAGKAVQRGDKKQIKKQHELLNIPFKG